MNGFCQPCHNDDSDVLFGKFGLILTGKIDKIIRIIVLYSFSVKVVIAAQPNIKYYAKIFILI